MKGSVSEGLDASSTPAAVAILIPVYDASAALDRTLASLAIASRELPLDVVVVFDGTRPTVSVPSSISRCIMLPGEGRGLAAALNVGLRHIVSGNYEAVARIDAGDEYVSGRFSRQLAVLRASPNIGAVGGQAECIDADGAVVGALVVPTQMSDVRRRLATNSPMIHPAVMLSVNAIRHVGFYDEAFRCCEDYELWLRLADKFDLANLDEVVVRYRISADQATHAKWKSMVRFRIKAQLKHWRAREPMRTLGALRSMALLAVPQGAYQRLRPYRLRNKR